MMRLYYTPNSPYSRKVRVAAIEKGLINQITLIVSPPNENSPDLHAANPLGKIPALVLKDGETVFDSPVICAYLDGLSAQNPLVPHEHKAHIRMRKTEALADGIMDACVARYLELMRPESERSARWIERWESAIARALDVLESGREPLPQNGFDLGAVALAAALDYIGLRYDSEWKKTRPKTAAWLETAKRRESMKATAPEI